MVSPVESEMVARAELSMLIMVQSLDTQCFNRRSLGATVECLR